jgi:uncharacterized protein DUF4145
MLLECPDCEAVVDAKEIADHEFNEMFEGGPVPWNSRATFASCPRCGGPMLGYQDDWGDGKGWNDPVRIYPPRDRNLHHSVPEAISAAFAEARVCLRAKAFTAAAIMCRKTLEGICSEHDVKSGTLAARLEKLKEKGVIENRLFDWAEALRAIGNEAAHDVDFVASREDAGDTIEFTEALIEYVFTYRHKFDEFMKRRAKAAATPKPKVKMLGQPKDEVF